MGARLNESMINAALAESWGVRASTAQHAGAHLQYGIVVFVGVDGEVTSNGTRGRVVLVPPNVMHRTTSPGPVLGFFYDPLSFPGVASFAHALDGPQVLGGKLGSRIAGAVFANRARIDHQEVLAGLSRDVGRVLASPPRPIDRRVLKALEAVRQPVPAMAKHAGVSVPHLRALFARDAGVPMRTVRAWRRLVHALQAYAHVDATRAAHEAGFADLAHFSRTCVRMLGYTPSTIRHGHVG